MLFNTALVCSTPIYHLLPSLTMSSASLPKAYVDALAPASTLSQITDVFGSTFAQREYEKAFGHASLAERLTKSLGLTTNLKDYASDFANMTSVKSLQNALASSALGVQFSHLDAAERAKRIVEKAFGGSTSLQEYAKALDITSQVKKRGLDLTVNLRAHNYMSALGTTAGSLTELSGANVGGLGYLTELRQDESAKWIRQLTTAMTEQDLYQRLMGSTALTQSFSNDPFSSVSQLAKDRYETLFSAKETWEKQVELFTRPAYLDSFLRTLEHDAELYNEVIDNGSGVPVNVAGAELLLGELAEAETPERFAELLSQCPTWLKWALVNFLVIVVFPFVTGISVNLVTPSVQAYLDNSPPPAPREQVKGLRNLSMGDIGVALSTYRFVTAQKLVLRRTPSSRAEQVDALSFGQVVAIVSSKRDWTEVTYEYGDGTVVSGWVYTRYLQKFRR
jgi:hypothetical protein